jgi:hypothetical protein
MSLARVLAVACALLASGLPSSGSTPGHQAEQKPPSTVPAQPFPLPAPTGTIQNKPETPPPGKRTTTKRHKKKVTAKKPVKPPEGENATEKRVVRNGSATDPTTQISPSVPPQKASSQMENTNVLLNSADANLKSISGTQLDANQEEMVKQVKNFMEQAKTAAGAGDVERANNLATKAQLLSAELVKK